MGWGDEANTDSRLQKKVEEALRSKMKARALKECDELVAKYAECARGRTISVAWKCRPEAQQLNVCLHQFTNDEAFEEYKRKYIEEPKRNA